MYTLTPREHEITLLISQGLSNKEIASIAGIGKNTVKIHVTSILRKLHLKRRVDVILMTKTQLSKIKSGDSRFIGAKD